MHATQQELKTLDRLLKRSDFLRLNGAGRKWVSKSMIVLASPNEQGSRRFGITVTKKLEKSAVRRNRMKRRLRAAASDVLPVRSVEGVDFVLIARAETASRPYADLCRDLRWCVDKLGHGQTRG